MRPKRLQNNWFMLRVFARRMSSMAERLIWVDCEMTGLNPKKHTLVEIATIVTDADLNIIAEGPDLVINQPEDVLNDMDDWCTKTFTENELLEKIKKSKVSLKDAEDMVLGFLEGVATKGKCPLAGNTVYMDRIFIREYMPRLEEFLHYRIVDVSTVKELSRRWYPKDFSGAPPKKCTHRALDDIRESIEELRFYRENVFKKPL